MNIDVEVSKIQELYQLLSSVDKSTQKRLITWAQSAFELDEYTQVDNVQQTVESINVDIDLTSPKLQTQPDIFLAACVVATEGDVGKVFSSRDVTKVLNAAGVRIANRNRALNILLQSNPAKLITVGRKLATKQSQNKLKLTKFGLDYINQIIYQ